jgi:nitroreductase
MMLQEIIKERRSIAKFQNKSVSREVLINLLDTSIWVPNHHLTEPWRFILIEGEGKRKLAEANRKLAEKRISDPEKREKQGQNAYDTIMNVPTIIVVVMREAANPMRREEDYASTCCVIQNFSLLAWERGIGAIWKTYGLMYQPDFREALEIELGEKVVGVLHVGYPDNIPAARHRSSVHDRITIIAEED